MVNRETVLVLGAGASVEYGYPAGRELRHQIIDLMRHPGRLNLLEAASQTPRSTIELFLAELRDSQLPSIDTFLSLRPEYLQVGKLCIAEVLVPCEAVHFKQQMDPRSHSDLHFYEYLWSQLHTTREQWQANRISVITFNYDRSLEHFLFKAVSCSFGISVSEAVEYLACIPIFHVHGTLGELNWQSRDGRPYGNNLTSTEQRLAASAGLKIAAEELENSAVIAQCQSVIREAEKVYFLGFGYLSANLERLSLKRVSGGKMEGTGFGLTNGERQRIVDAWPIDVGPTDLNCLKYLRSIGGLV